MNVYVNEEELKAAYIGHPFIDTPWIYRSEEEGLISLSKDWTTWYTIADKNLGATTVWWEWKVYQRGNNYGFNPSSYTTTSTAVNLTNYWPWNYYSSSVFNIARPYDTSWNLNLWGWVTWTNEAMQWPCLSGFHIPSTSEYVSLADVMTTLWMTLRDNYVSYLKMPRQNAIYNNTLSSNLFYYWTSSWYDSANKLYAYVFRDYGTGVLTNQTSERKYWFPIRPFANTPIQPDSSRIKLY